MTENEWSWETVEIGGKAADVLSPTDPTDVNHAVLFLHGASERTINEDSVFTAALARHGLPTVCPHGGRAWWLDRVVSEFDDAMTPMAFLRERIVPWIEARWGVEPPHIGLLGISMGGQGAIQLAYRHARQFPVVAAISPAVDFQTVWGQGTPLDTVFLDAEAARQETATLHLHPLNWPRHQMIVCDPTDPFWFDGAERLASKLTSMGIPYECELETVAGGHSWEYFHAMADRCVAFLANALGSL